MIVCVSQPPAVLIYQTIIRQVGKEYILLLCSLYTYECSEINRILDALLDHP